MRFSSSIAILAAAGFAAAQSTTIANTLCAQNIVDACVASTSIQKDNCTPNDWSCLCSAWTNILTCYDNCPSSPDRFGVSQTKLANCNAAAAYGTTSSSLKTTPTASGSSVSATAANTASGSTASATGTAASATKSSTSTASAAAQSSGNAASNVVIPAVGGLVAVMAGFAGLL